MKEKCSPAAVNGAAQQPRPLIQDRENPYIVNSVWGITLLLGRRRLLLFSGPPGEEARGMGPDEALTSAVTLQERRVVKF